MNRAHVKDVLEKIAGDWPQRELDRSLPDRVLRAYQERFAVPDEDEQPDGA